MVVVLSSRFSQQWAPLATSSPLSKTLLTPATVYSRVGESFIVQTLFAACLELRLVLPAKLQRSGTAVTRKSSNAQRRFYGHSEDNSFDPSGLPCIFKKKNVGSRFTTWMCTIVNDLDSSTHVFLSMGAIHHYCNSLLPGTLLSFFTFWTWAGQAFTVYPGSFWYTVNFRLDNGSNAITPSEVRGDHPFSDSI